MRELNVSMMACILMISAVFFTSCGDDGTNESPNPISELVFPKSDADNPISAGQLVQIGGKGFADDCDIWLQGTGDSEVETEIKVSSDGVSFIAPNISGEYTVVLEQGGEVYTLGSLFFAEMQEESHLFVWGDDEKKENSSFYEYNKDKGVFNLFATIGGRVWKAVLSGENSIIYYFHEGAGLYSYDLKVKKEKQILESGWLAKTEEGGTGQAIGLIDNKLHGVKYSQKDGFALVAIAGDGKETVIQKFKALPSPDGNGNGNFYGEDDNLIFTYDETNQTLFLSGNIETKNESCAILVALNRKTEKVETLMDEKAIWYQCLNVNEKIWLFAETDKGDTQVVSQINPSTLKTEQVINELSDNYVYRPVYSKTENVIYWTGFTGTTEDMSAVISYNVQTKKLAAVSKTSFEVEGVFVAI